MPSLKNSVRMWPPHRYRWHRLPLSDVGAAPYPNRRHFPVPFAEQECPMELVVPDVLQEGCATRQALERLASNGGCC